MGLEHLTFHFRAEFNTSMRAVFIFNMLLRVEYKHVFGPEQIFFKPYLSVLTSLNF